MLHPYYKLDYIKMAWGGPEEMKKELEAGNALAKDWHDEALKVLEETMEAYWEEPEQQQPAASNAPASPPDDDETLESEFDHHHRNLVQSLPSTAGGCAAECHCYLSDHPSDVMKDTDIVKWWLVRCFLLYIHTLLITPYRHTGIATPPLPALPRMFVQFQLHQSHVNSCFPQVPKLQLIAVHALVQTSLSIFKSSSMLGARRSPTTQKRTCPKLR